MSATFHIRHQTEYRYAFPISLSHNQARLLPRAIPGQQTVKSAKLKISPRPEMLSERTDGFGNNVRFFSIEHAHEVLRVTLLCDVVVDRPPVELPDSPAWEVVANHLVPADLASHEFRNQSPLIPINEKLRAYTQPSFPSGRPLLEAVDDFNHRIFRDFEFLPDFTDVTTPLSDVLKHRAGVCQDFAQLAIGGLRSMGLPARYVSGYIETLAPPGKKKLVGADASHAWFSTYVPGQGWFDFDPTNDQRPSGRHIVSAYGRDFTDATPLKGVVYGGGKQKLIVKVDVNRVS